MPAGSVNDGNGGNNYSVTLQNATDVVINARYITVTAATATKTYDGSTSALGLPTVTSTTQLAAGDSWASLSESFDNRNAGAGKTLSATGLVSDGNGGGNYMIHWAPVATGAINKELIQVTAQAATKDYDGLTTSATVPLLTSGVIYLPDVAAFSETYDTPAEGTGKTMTPGGIVSDQNGGNNYAYDFVSEPVGVILPSQHPTQLVLTTPSSVTAGSSFGIEVFAEDSTDHVVAGDDNVLTFSSGDTHGSLPSATMSNGAGFSVGSLETASSTGWVIVVTDAADGLTATSTAIPVAAAAASQAVFTQGPVNTTAGSTLASATSTPVEVTIEDPYGNVISSGSASTAYVTVALNGGQFAAGSTTTVQAVAGVATFSTLSIDQTGSYTLTDSSTAVGGSNTTPTFIISPSAATQLVFPALWQPSPSYTSNAGVESEALFDREGAHRRRLRQHGDRRHLRRDLVLERGRQRRRRGDLQRQHHRPGHRQRGRRRGHLQRPVDRQPQHHQLHRRRHGLQPGGQRHRQRQPADHRHVRRPSTPR